MDFKLLQAHKKLSFLKFENVKDVQCSYGKLFESMMRSRNLRVHSIHRFENILFDEVDYAFGKKKLVLESFNTLD